MGGSVDELMDIIKQPENGGEDTPPKHLPDVVPDDTLRLYASIIADKNAQIIEKDARLDVCHKWMTRLFIIALLVIIVLIGLLIFDIFDPFIGYIRR